MNKLRHRSQRELPEAPLLVVCTVRTLTQGYLVVKGHSLSQAGDLGINPLPFLLLPSPSCPSHVVELLSASRLMIANNPIRKRHVRAVAQSGAGRLESRDQSERVALRTAQCRGGLARRITEGPIREARAEYTIQWRVSTIGRGSRFGGHSFKGPPEQTRDYLFSFPQPSPDLHGSRLLNF